MEIKIKRLKTALEKLKSSLYIHPQLYTTLRPETWNLWLLFLHMLGFVVKRHF